MSTDCAPLGKSVLHCGAQKEQIDEDVDPTKPHPCFLWHSARITFMLSITLSGAQACLSVGGQPMPGHAVVEVQAAAPCVLHVCSEAESQSMVSPIGRAPEIGMRLPVAKLKKLHSCFPLSPAVRQTLIQKTESVRSMLSKSSPGLLRVMASRGWPCLMCLQTHEL